MAFHIAHSDLVLGDLERCSYHNSMEPPQNLHLLAESVKSVWRCFDALKKAKGKHFFLFQKRQMIGKITLLVCHLIKHSILK